MGANTVKQAGMALGGVICVLLIGRAWLGPHQVPTGSCGTAPPLRGPVDPWLILAILVVAAAAGWAVGGWRRASSSDEDRGMGGGPGDAAEDAAERRQTIILVQLGLCIFLAGMTFGLAYEGWSLVPGGCHWPLTYYVRWLTKTDPWMALPVAMILSFLTGRWLWYPRSTA